MWFGWVDGKVDGLQRSTVGRSENRPQSWSLIVLVHWILKQVVCVLGTYCSSVSDVQLTIQEHTTVQEVVEI